MTGTDLGCGIVGIGETLGRRHKDLECEGSNPCCILSQGTQGLPPSSCFQACEMGPTIALSQGTKECLLEEVMSSMVTEYQAKASALPGGRWLALRGCLSIEEPLQIHRMRRASRGFIGAQRLDQL